jgi:hypothetical protein
MVDVNERWTQRCCLLLLLLLDDAGVLVLW